MTPAARPGPSDQISLTVREAVLRWATVNVPRAGDESGKTRFRTRNPGQKPVLRPGISNPLQILDGAEPKVGGPDLHPELAAQEDGRYRPSSAKVQNPHAGPQLKRLSELLDKPKRVRAATRLQNPTSAI